MINDFLVRFGRRLRKIFSQFKIAPLGLDQTGVTKKNGVDHSSWEDVLQEREIGRLRRGAIQKQLRELYRCASIGIAPPPAKLNRLVWQGGGENCVLSWG